MEPKVGARNTLLSMGTNTTAIAGVRVLLFGQNGWIGSMIGELLQQAGIDFEFATARMENREAVLRELDQVKPTHVINAAGVTGRPNIDWCESHKAETLRANMIGTLNLADCCNMQNVHSTIFATGCIYEYDESHPEGSGKGFTEEDPPNFSGSFYSKTKGMLEELLKVYEANTLVLRVRMPISDDLHHRNFITKISKYEKVVNVPNSMTVLYDMVPLAIIMGLRKHTGVFNFTNPGVISHNQCLDLYKEYIDPKFTYTNFSIAEQSKVLVAARSNNELDVSKLLEAVPDIYIEPIQEAVRKSFKRMAAAMSTTNSNKRCIEEVENVTQADVNKA